MGAWRSLVAGVRVLRNRDAADRDVADEVRHYYEEATAQFIASGMSPDAARREARVVLGNMTVAQEEVRSFGWENLLESVVADVRIGARRLRTSPGFTAVTAIILALGIGATTAIFSAVNPVLFESLPYPHADRIVMLWDTGIDGSRLEFTFGTYRELLARSRSLESITVMRAWQPTMTGGIEPERLDGQRVSADYFRVLGVRPALGRDLAASDDLPNAPRVAIVSDRLWQRRFGGDVGIVGRQVVLDDVSYTVVGVMPRGFENVLSPSADIWRALQYDPSLPPDSREWGHHLRAVARMRPSADVDAVRRELADIARSPIPDFRRPRWASMQQGLTAASLQEEMTLGVRPALLAVLGAVLLVLTIACVNVTNLLLARGARQRGEFAVRTALGAGRTRLVRQLLIESLLLALIGAILGLAVAELGVRALVALSPPGLPRLDAIALDAPAFACAFVVTTIAGLAIGIVPALHASAGDVHLQLVDSGRRTVGRNQFSRRLLVVSEVAIALVLLVCAGLLMRSLQHLFAVPPGFDSSHLLTMQVQMSGSRVDDEDRHRFFARALDAVRDVPGVASAAWTSQLPLSGDFDAYGVHFDADVPTSPEDSRGGFRYTVSPGFFETLRIPLRRGRVLDERDSANAPFAVLISESFARRKFPGRDPLGRRVRVGPADSPPAQIVGVVGDVKQMSLALSESDAVYMTTAQWRFADTALWLVVRTHGDAASLAPAVKQAVWSVNKDQPIVRVATMDHLVAVSAAERRFALIVFEAFALVALLLAATGIYGVLAASVAERTAEMGVRAALGASPAAILKLVAGEGMTLTIVGLLAGVGGAVAASRALISLLFGVSPLDAATYAGTIALLLAVAAIASAIPAWRAANVDAAVALRTG